MWLNIHGASLWRWIRGWRRVVGWLESKAPGYVIIKGNSLPYLLFMNARRVVGICWKNKVCWIKNFPNRKFICWIMKYARTVLLNLSSLIKVLLVVLMDWVVHGGCFWLTTLDYISENTHQAVFIPVLPVSAYKTFSAAAAATTSKNTVYSTYYLFSNCMVCF